MRLIDADKLIENLMEEIPNAENIHIFKDIVENQEIAYDVEKVIEKLFDVAIERYGNDGGMGGEMVVNLDDAVEIVKGCEGV